ncbi:lipopolysaccharide N-acetylmannosaminouronosyltransferase [Mycoavidus sp. B2-EB]|uniref:lipopolysaccharide N-acetylmannosaminouronosyltransferase n=1 Tax=Mycoavidus sp. B2-EB TaxID=2651972 RepID=UPI001626A5AF|nr:lipopolysaccharide N-acetylmannosaminouronosyltransferase [Mycoavidus sp. B2-EB]BBO60031.1 UDP-N-acetyl-D-mannosaminuronic acid transferase [Mycoavidus sp. B2-EB]
MDSIPKYNIRGIDIWGFQRTVELADYLLADGALKTGMLVAINAEKVILAEQDRALCELIQAAKYKYADGVSIVRSIKRKYSDASYLQRIAGIDLWLALMRRAGARGIPVFLVGGEAGVLAKVERKLMTDWGVKIVGSHNGYFKDEERSTLFQLIQKSGAALVTVALGSPKQEIFMRHCQKVYPKALYMGVGGTFDVFSGKVKRAPKAWQHLGLEWLYRILAQPTRLRRVARLFKYACYHYSGRL